MTASMTINLPDYKVAAAPIYWEPIMGSGERIVGAVAAIGGDGAISVSSVLSPNTLKTLFSTQGESATNMLGWVCESLKKQLSDTGSFEDVCAPLAGFQVGSVADYLGDDMEDVVSQIRSMYAAFSFHKEDKAVDVSDAYQSRDINSVRLSVCEIVKMRAGIKAERILTPGGKHLVEDESGKHFLDIPVHTGNRIGSITSAWYKTAQSVENNLLKAQSNITSIASNRKVRGGVFISRPFYGLSEKLLHQIDNKVDEYVWRMEKANIKVFVRDKDSELAEDILEFANV